MTKQEAQALAERLTRVWQLSPSDLQWIEANGEVGVFGQITDEVRFCYIWHNGSYQIELPRIQNGRTNGRLFYRVITGEIGRGVSLSPVASLPLEHDQFASEWMDFFRRGCWLSGCDIEASAHEKAEWLQGFTKEEIEAWKLKM